MAIHGRLNKSCVSGFVLDVGYAPRRRMLIFPASVGLLMWQETSKEQETEQLNFPGTVKAELWRRGRNLKNDHNQNGRASLK